MQAYRYRATVQADHRLSLQLPPEVPVGEVEVIVLSSEAETPLGSESPVQQIASIRGVLTRGPMPEGDPVRSALDESRAERNARHDRLIDELAGESKR